MATLTPNIVIPSFKVGMKNPQPWHDVAKVADDILSPLSISRHYD